MPFKDIAEDELFICVGWILTSALMDKEIYDIILQAKI
jgi:hypothetical protein